jgi:RNA polymerase sigma factor (sigma-70 family)
MNVETLQALEWPSIYRRIKRDPGDSHAFTSLRSKIHRWARRDFWGQGDLWVDDVVDDTCFKVVEHIYEAFGEKCFSGFVAGHYRNVRRRYFREVERSRNNSQLEDVKSSCPPNDSEEDTSFKHLKDCIDRLPVRERTAVTMRYNRTLPYEKVARVLEVKAGNARKIVSMAIKLLRNCMQEKMAPA